MFRDKVVVKDHEEKDSDRNNLVNRSLVLPLARSHDEAADWGSRLKKGSRVYCMYPMTTSLYAATVMDNSTYCRGDDDIIVVEFDGDEADATGKMPHYHIPARFVTLIPREFPAAQTQKKKRSPPVALPPKSSHKKANSDLSGFLDEVSYTDLASDIDLDQFGLLG